MKFGGGSEVCDECQKTFCSSCVGLRKDGGFSPDRGLAPEPEGGLRADFLFGDLCLPIAPPDKLDPDAKG